MLPDRVSSPGPLTYESGALPIALRGPALLVGAWHVVVMMDTMLVGAWHVVVMMDTEISYKGSCEKMSHFLDLVSHTVDPVLRELFSLIQVCNKNNAKPNVISQMSQVKGYKSQVITHKSNSHKSKKSPVGFHSIRDNSEGFFLNYE